MTVIVCVDNNMGILFNCRRQSKDKALRERVLKLSSKSTLWMSPYTKKQFEEPANNIFVADNYLAVADDDAYCFVEGTGIMPCLSKIERLIIYKWNKVYPCDEFLDVCLDGWCVESSTDFVGNSHEKITEEVYIRRDQ